MSQENIEKNKYLVKKVSLADTFSAIPVGVSVLDEAPVAGTFAAAIVAVSRLNSKCEGVFKIVSEDNGATYLVQRVG